MSSLTTRFALAALLFAAAALTGCNAAPTVTDAENFPSFLGSSHDNGEPVSTLGANFSSLQESHHGTRLHIIPSRNYARPTHHSL